MQRPVRDDDIAETASEVTDGRSLAIGVTGHRTLADLEQVSNSVTSVLDRLLTDGVTPVVVTSLAEGADRFVTDMIVDRGGTVEVILPLAPEVYVDDFETPESRRRFGELLELAAHVVMVDSQGDAREAAYEAAGHAMVQRSDVLIALWDGEPAQGRGGTAEIIQYALDEDVMVEIVLVERAS